MAGISSSSVASVWQVVMLFISAYLTGFVLTYIYINHTELLESEACQCHHGGGVEEKNYPAIKKQAGIELGKLLMF